MNRYSLFFLFCIASVGWSGPSDHKNDTTKSSVPPREAAPSTDPSTDAISVLQDLANQFSSLNSTHSPQTGEVPFPGYQGN